MKHASALAGNPNVNEDQAKIIYRVLRKGAGIFKLVQDRYFEKLANQPVKGKWYQNGLFFLKRLTS